MSYKALNILLSNDDGYQAKGIQTLWQGLQTQHHLTLVAPRHDCSGKGQSITLDRPLRLQAIGDRQYWVDGTPADAVMLGLSAVLPEGVDVLLSGINHGANLGDDCLYSGTLGAALEARHYASVCLAVSLCGHQHFDTALAMVQSVLAQWPVLLASSAKVFSLNVPDLPLSQVKGLKLCALGSRGKPLAAQAVANPKDQQLYWIGLPGVGQGPDFDAIAQGYATLTPISTDRTDLQSLKEGLACCE